MAKKRKKARKKAASEKTELGSNEVIRRINAKEMAGKDLSVPARIRVVNILRHQFTQAEIAELLGVCDKTIERDVKAIKSDTAEIVAEITVDAIVAELSRVATFLKGRAVKDKDYKLAWQIEMDYIKAVQDLGCVKRAPTEIKGEINHTFEGLEDNELDSIFRDCFETRERNGGRAVGRKGAAQAN